jgi:RNA polymerase sigma factor (sigma-70 family)
MGNANRQAPSAQDESFLLRLLLRDIKKFPVLTESQEVEILRRMAAGEETFRSLLVVSNLRFVLRRAAVYRHLYQARGMDLCLMDLFSEGVLGLMTAARKANPSFHTRFLSYASYRINARMMRFAYLQRRHFAEPLDAVIEGQPGEESGMTLLDQIASDNVDPAESIDVEQLLDGLRPREKKVLSMRYLQERTLGQVGTALGISKERARQIEGQGLFKLRESFEERRPEV